ncbi:MAG: hypothetical protein Q4D23_06090 [Bacteroidales bacterium]|nr:hypothetical protein [Bacteroidales bacterium]
MKRIYLLYIVLCALVSFTIIPEANAQTSSPRSGGPRGGAGAPFWTCPDTLREGIITIDVEYINRKPGQNFGAERDYSINELGNYSNAFGHSFGQSLVGGRGKRYTLQSSEPVLLAAHREWFPCFFIANPGQHLHVIRDASLGDSIVDIREDGRSILAFERRDEVTDFVQALNRDYSGLATFPAEYIHERLIDCATNPDVARRNLQPFIDLPFKGRPQGLSIGYSTGAFILRSSMIASDEEPTDDAGDDDSEADETDPSQRGSISPIYREEHGGLARFRADLESHVQLPPEDELPERGICTLIIELGKKGEMLSHTVYHSFSPAFDAALSEGIAQLFPFDAPARIDGKPCQFRIILPIIYRKHGTTREQAAAAASDLSVFMPFINTFTLSGAEVPLAVKLADVRLNGKLLPHWTITDYGDFVHQEPGMPSLDINSKAYDAEPYATWFTQLEEQLKTNLQMTQHQRDSLASAFNVAIMRYREHATRLPSFYETIDTKFNGDSYDYVAHIFRTSLLFNRRRFYRFREDLDHAHLFEDEGFNFLISVLDFAKQLE